ncbi:hypothetical protein LTR66_003446 [Elasticomyces elasticus]|nr:hypothetical protein LTR66_003446 [Elasticomyces elasticus]
MEDTRVQEARYKRKGPSNSALILESVSLARRNYIKYLPAELLPTFWSDRERELLIGTTLAPAVSAKKRSLYREFERLRSSTAHLPWCVRCWWDEVDGLVTFDDWLQVDAMYRSRALEFPGLGDCMVPCVDMANHASGDATAALYECDGDGDALLLLRDGKILEDGDEVTITYGDEKGACEMVFSYGFIEDGMESARSLFLDLSMVQDDPLKKAKAAVSNAAPGFRVLERDSQVGWEGDYIWLVCVNEENGLDFSVAQTVDGDQELRAFWKGKELKDMSNFKALLEPDPMWNVFQLRAVSLLQDRIASQLTTLYGSDEQVEATPRGEGTDVRDGPWRIAVHLRRLESELLERAYEYFEEQKVRLAEDDVVQKYLASAGSEQETSEDFS